MDRWSRRRPWRPPWLAGRGSAPKPPPTRLSSAVRPGTGPERACRAQRGQVEQARAAGAHDHGSTPPPRREAFDVVQHTGHGLGQGGLERTDRTGERVHLIAIDERVLSEARWAPRL